MINPFRKLKPLSKEEALAFLKTQELTVDDLTDLSIRVLGNLFDKDPVHKEDEIRIWQEAKKIEGFSEYLLSTMSRDVKRHFQSFGEAQREVRGSYARTLYFLSLLRKRETSEMEKDLPKLGGDRYHYGGE